MVWFLHKTSIIQKIRIGYYHYLSSNKPVLYDSKINQPVYWVGLGNISAKKTNFGVSISPYFLSGYMYIEARSKDSTISIGENTVINNNAVIIADKMSIDIGASCLIGCNFMVFDSDFHGLSTTNRLNGKYESKPVFIQDNVFIGNNVTVTKGVTIGKNSVIGSGSIVTSDVKENSIYAGNPAKFIKCIPV